MALVAHLEIHKMDIKTIFPIGNIDETICMTQPENFMIGNSKSTICKLKKSIYRIKKASHQWYPKFHRTIIPFRFEMHMTDECVYHFLTLVGANTLLMIYLDETLLATDNINLLHETKRFISSNLEIKDMNKGSYV